ncbi:hypothetical protein [Halostella sp. PRR32]|uniref:hypothetical protein n=1 Tax=Halostella sp. PRR32 TaxID=3098147 RepID=UPI002B1E5090|nr:hypothetical protein [Halostella sp. PRR32]
MTYSSPYEVTPTDVVEEFRGTVPAKHLTQRRLSVAAPDAALQLVPHPTPTFRPVCLYGEKPGSVEAWGTYR